jgi:hypothetical protein
MFLQVVPGQKKKTLDRRPGFVSRRILDYNVPKQLKETALDVESAGRLLDLYPVLGEELSLENYSQKFKALIHLVNIYIVVERYTYHRSGFQRQFV